MLKRIAAFPLILAYSFCLAASAQQKAFVPDRLGIHRPPMQVGGGSQGGQGIIRPNEQSANGQSPQAQVGHQVQPRDRSSRGALLNSHSVPQSGAGSAKAPIAAGPAKAPTGAHVFPGESSSPDAKAQKPQGHAVQRQQVGPRIAPVHVSRSATHQGYRHADESRVPLPAQPVRSQSARAQPVRSKSARSQSATATYKTYKTVPSGKMAF